MTKNIKKRNAAEFLSISEIRSKIRSGNLQRNQRKASQATILETHKKIQPVIKTETLPKWANFLHNSIKFVKYNSRIQFKSKPSHLPLPAVSLHYDYSMISAAANKTQLYILYVQIKPISSKTRTKSILTQENEAYICTTIEVIPCWSLDRYWGAAMLSRRL